MDVFPQGHQLGPYRVVRLLGEGGMGAVYEARQELLDRRVALKTLHPEYAKNKDAITRFFNEAKALSRLEHPNIVQVFDFGTTDDGTSYLVMEYLRGHTLGRRLRELHARGERLPITAGLHIGFQVADVLAVAHAEGIIHRDIKPDNLMMIGDAVAPGGERVKILDFGIAKLTPAMTHSGVKTATQTVMGTPSYMSPEQCAGAGGVDFKTDVYALGCVLFEILAGRPPFVAEGPGQIIGMHLFQSPPSLRTLAPSVSEAVVELVNRLLTKDKALRPSMTETADAIGRLLQKTAGTGRLLRSRPLSVLDANSPHSLVPIPHPGTTLGRSTGQQSPRLPRRAFFLAGCLASVLVGALIVARRVQAPPVLEKKDRPPPTTAPSTNIPLSVAQTGINISIAADPRASQNQQQRVITWTIESEPPGCKVIDENGTQLGTTPYTSTKEAVPGEVAVRLRHDGYTDSIVSLSRDRSQTRRVTLNRTLPILRKKDAPRNPQATVTNSASTRTALGTASKTIGYEKD